MKRIFRYFLYFCGVILFLLFIGFCIVWIYEYRPQKRRVQFTTEKLQRLPNDTLKIVSWNTGYAGLGDDMDFFYDGGSRMRTSEERTLENLNRISDFLSRCNADVVLLQEVDVKSRRSYYINQRQEYKRVLAGYFAYSAYNYDALFVPVPLKQPMGRVKAGNLTLSKVCPAEVIRYQYPGGFPFPVRIFNLKRCLLSSRFITRSGRSILINNTHNTAYDTGEMRTLEMQFLRDTLTAAYEQGIRSITGGDWNQNPPDYTQSAAETDDPYFSPIKIDSTLFPKGWTFSYDRNTPTARYLYEPLSPTTTVTTIDMFLTSPGIRCIAVETVDLGFKNSDHNPVIATFVVEGDTEH